MWVVGFAWCVVDVSVVGTGVVDVDVDVTTGFDEDVDVSVDADIVVGVDVDEVPNVLVYENVEVDVIVDLIFDADFNVVVYVGGDDNVVVSFEANVDVDLKLDTNVDVVVVGSSDTVVDAALEVEATVVFCHLLVLLFDFRFLLFRFFQFRRLAGKQTTPAVRRPPGHLRRQKRLKAADGQSLMLDSLPEQPRLYRNIRSEEASFNGRLILQHKARFENELCSGFEYWKMQKGKTRGRH